MTNLTWLRLQLRIRQSSDQCWEWPWGTNDDGYAIVRITGRGKQVKVSHIVLEATSGPAPSSKPCACHSCDNPACFNPRHLWWGSVADNSKDMWSKGRGKRPINSLVAYAGQYDSRGERNGNSRLTAEQVAEIRERFMGGGITRKALAQEYGVGAAHIGRIVSGKRW